MTEPAEHILRRIRSLLNVAEHVSTGEAERDAAMAKASTLMATYGVQRAMLDASGLGSGDPIDATSIDIDDPYSYEKSLLLVKVAQALGCKPMSWTRGRRITRIDIVGTATDRERVNMLYTSLSVQAARGVLGESSPYRDAADTKARRAAYLAGFATRIGERLREAEAHAARDYDEQRPAGSPSTALVLADRAALVNRRFSELYPNTRPRGNRSYRTSAYHRGMSAGSAADIGGSKVTSASTRRLGAAR
jgi:Protein of unknown function (DUF2786)